MDAAKEVGMSKMRFAAWSQTRGTYLGDGVFSNDRGAAAFDSAPTFPHKTHRGDVPGYPEDLDFNLSVVFPDKGDRATPRACANALLPRWGD